MAAAPPRTREVTGVEHGLSVVSALAGQPQPQPQPPRFIAQRVRVEEAGDLLALLALDIAGGQLLNRGALESVDRAAHILCIFKELLVPKLRVRPTKPGLLVLVDGCAHALRVESAAAGGTFATQGRGFAERVEDYVEQARSHPVYSSYAALQDTVNDLRRRAEHLLQETCTLRNQAAPMVAAAAADGAADVAAEESAAEESAAEEAAEEAE